MINLIVVSAAVRYMAVHTPFDSMNMGVWFLSILSSAELPAFCVRFQNPIVMAVWRSGYSSVWSVDSTGIEGAMICRPRFAG